MDNNLIRSELNSVVNNLLAQRRLTSFILTSSCFGLLKEAEIPLPTLTALESLKNKQFWDSKSLINALNETIGEQATRKYRKVILAATRRADQIFCKTAEKCACIFADYVNNFAEHPDQSIVSTGWITNTIVIYASIDSVEISDKFFSNIDFACLTKTYQRIKVSFLKKYIEYLTIYLRKKPVELSNRMLNDVFKVIDLRDYTKDINIELERIWSVILKDSFTSDNESTLLRTISNIARCFFVASNLTNNSELRLYIRSKVTEFLTLIKLGLLGKIVEAKSRKLGNISTLLEMMKRAKCDKSIFIKYLSEINFKRLAIEFNETLPSRSALKNFYTNYSKAKGLNVSWRIFFDTVDFHKVGNLGYTDLSFLFDVLRQIYSNETDKVKSTVTNKINQLDFRHIGIRMQGKPERSLDKLFRNMLKFRIEPKNYRMLLDQIYGPNCDSLKQDSSAFRRIIAMHRTPGPSRYY